MPTPNFHGPQFSIEFDADTTRFLRVKINTDKEAAICGAGDKSDGVCWMNDVDISEDAIGTIRTPAAGTLIMVASKAIAAGDRVYADASGKVTDAVGAVLEGVALTAASGDGAYIEVLPVGAEVTRMITHTVTSAEDTANSATIDTGLGVVLTGVVERTRTSAGVERTGNTVTFGSGANAGEVTVANTNLAENDVITLFASATVYDV